MFSVRVGVEERQDKLPAMHWLPKLTNDSIKLGLLRTLALALLQNFPNYSAVKSHVIRYCETVYEKARKICLVYTKFWRGTCTY